jgi:hypothetical protein
MRGRVLVGVGLAAGVVALVAVWRAPPATQEPRTVPLGSPSTATPGQGAAAVPRGERPGGDAPSGARAEAVQTIAPDGGPPETGGEPQLSPAEVGAAMMAGEQALEDGDLLSAIAAFTRIVEGAPDADLAPFAAYKLAWSSWNAGDLPGAILEMERALTWLESSPVPGADVLAREAGADLERFRAVAPSE